MLPLGYGQECVKIFSRSCKSRQRLSFDEEQEREFVFLTNATHISSLLVAELYKNRWQIELFFKWLKQHLKIKKFWGTTENAVRIQIYIAISTYLLVSIVKHDMQLDRSIYKILQILNISLTDKPHLKDLFDKINFNMTKTDSALMGLIYLMFNSSLIFMGH